MVTSVGDGVTNVREGDRVAIEPGVPCRACNYCKTGVYNLCPQMSFCATPPVHGNLCRSVAKVYLTSHTTFNNNSDITSMRRTSATSCLTT